MSISQVGDESPLLPLHGEVSLLRDPNASKLAEDAAALTSHRGATQDDITIGVVLHDVEALLMASQEGGSANGRIAASPDAATTTPAVEAERPTLSTTQAQMMGEAVNPAAIADLLIEQEKALNPQAITGAYWGAEAPFTQSNSKGQARSRRAVRDEAAEQERRDRRNAAWDEYLETTMERRERFSEGPALDV